MNSHLGVYTPSRDSLISNRLYTLMWIIPAYREKRVKTGRAEVFGNANIEAVIESRPHACNYEWRSYVS